MADEALKTFRRLVREAHQQMQAETLPARKQALKTVLASRRLDLERYQRSAKPVVKIPPR